MTAALDALLSDPSRAGVLVDFDGTLSEIAPSPEDATAVPGAAEALEALAAGVALVAVVSGRPAAEVGALLGRPAGVRTFGLYGLEDERGPADPSAEGLAELARAILPEVEAIAASVPGGRVEPKGLQVAVHYRAAPDPVAARTALLEGLRPVAARAEMRLLEGKRVVELAPEGGPSKGDVVRRVAAEHHLSALLYAGDDLADREAFAAVRRMRDVDVAAVAIAVRSAETPEALLAAADLTVEGPSELVRLLRGLVDRLSRFAE